MQPSANKGVIEDRQRAVRDLSSLTFEAEVIGLRAMLRNPLVQHLAANVAKCHRLAHKGTVHDDAFGGAWTPKVIGNHHGGKDWQRLLGPLISMVNACEHICQTMEACQLLQENSDSRRVHRLLLPSNIAAHNHPPSKEDITGIEVHTDEWNSVISFEGLMPPLRRLLLSEVRPFFNADALSRLLLHARAGSSGEVDDSAICEELGRSDPSFQKAVKDVEVGKKRQEAFLRQLSSDPHCPWCKSMKGVEVGRVQNEAVLEVPAQCLDSKHLPKSFVLVKTTKSKQMCVACV